MPKTRGKFKTLMDRRKIAAMLREGKNNVQIARELGISHQTVGRDIKELTRMWKDTHISDVVDYKAMELQRLNHIEGQMWEAWEASQKGKTIHVHASLRGIPTEDDPNPEPIPGSVGVATENNHGDTRYTQVILKVSHQRCMLMGLYEPVERPLREQAKAEAQMTEEERARRVESARAMLQKLRRDSEAARRAQSDADTLPAL